VFENNLNYFAMSETLWKLKFETLTRFQRQTLLSIERVPKCNTVDSGEIAQGAAGCRGTFGSSQIEHFETMQRRHRSCRVALAAVVNSYPVW